MSTYRRFNPQMQFRRARSSESHLSKNFVKTCKHCGKQFQRETATRVIDGKVQYIIRSGAGKFFCSHDCRMAHMQENARSEMEKRKIDFARLQLKRGVSFQNKTKQLKERLVMRVGGECQICTTNYSKLTYLLDVHHIDKDPSNNTDDNLALLCCVCHRKLHHGDVVLKGGGLGSATMA